MRNFSLLFMLLIACNGSGSKLESGSIATNNQTQKMLSISDDQFIFDAIENDLELKNIETICQDFKREYKVVNNRNSDKLDTVAVFYNNADTISIYNAGNKKLILKMSLSSNRIGLLNDSIKIGLTKDFFIKKYPSVKDNDIFEICNVEGLNCFRFIISNGILSNIKYQSSYMD